MRAVAEDGELADVPGAAAAGLGGHQGPEPGGGREGGQVGRGVRVADRVTVLIDGRTRPSRPAGLAAGWPRLGLAASPGSRSCVAEVPEPHAAGDDERRRRCHRGPGDQRVEESGGGQRDRGDVVAERPGQVAGGSRPMWPGPG